MVPTDRHWDNVASDVAKCQAPETKSEEAVLLILGVRFDCFPNLLLDNTHPGVGLEHVGVGRNRTEHPK